MTVNGHRPSIADRIVPARLWAAQPTPPALVPDWLPAQGLAVLYGAPGAAKSLIALDFAGQATTGGAWCDHKIEPIARVLYVAAEAPWVLAPRHDAWCEHYDAEPSIDVLPEVVHLGSDAAAGELAAHIATNPYPVVVLDTWTRCTAGLDENSGRDIGPAVERLLALNPTGLTVILHHPTKADDKVMRGHGSLLAALDTSIHVGRSGDARTLTATKQRAMADGATANVLVEAVGDAAVVHPLAQGDDGAVAALHLDDTRAQWAQRLAQRYGISLRTAHSRITEAVDAGLVVNTGTRQRAAYRPRSQ